MPSRRLPAHLRPSAAVAAVSRHFLGLAAAAAAERGGGAPCRVRLHGIWHGRGLSPSACVAARLACGALAAAAEGGLDPAGVAAALLSWCHLLPTPSRAPPLPGCAVAPGCCGRRQQSSLQGARRGQQAGFAAALAAAAEDVRWALQRTSRRRRCEGPTRRPSKAQRAPAVPLSSGLRVELLLLTAAAAQAAAWWRGRGAGGAGTGCRSAVRGAAAAAAAAAWGTGTLPPTPASPAAG